jgi:hypothetical protein
LTPSNEKGDSLLIGIAILGDNIVTKKYSENISKYDGLTITIHHIFCVKTNMLLVIIRVIATI